MRGAGRTPWGGGWPRKTRAVSAGIRRNIRKNIHKSQKKMSDIPEVELVRVVSHKNTMQKTSRRRNNDDERMNEDRGEAGRKSHDDWVIGAVCLGDGKKRGKFFLHKNRWYATVPSPRDASGYYHIEPNSMSMPNFVARAVRDPTVCVGVARDRGSPLRCRVLGDEGSAVHQSSRLIKGIMQYCTRHHGVSVVTYCLGARESNMSLEKY